MFSETSCFVTFSSSINYNVKSRNSTVGIVTGYGLDGRRVGV
jgi:hypothetical protein